MATWCPSCLKHLSQLAILKNDTVALFAVPIDPQDDAEKLGEYVLKHSPPYEMLQGVTAVQKETVNGFLSRSLKVASPGLPSSVIADSDGNVVAVIQGIPTVSQLRKLKK